MRCGGEKRFMASKEELIQQLMYQPENIRNMGIAAHIDHGKV